MDLSSLNDKQLEAVTAPKGPVLVLAGAGSGKTRALAFRIAYLCERGLISPDNILALTFTNKAAKEMSERVRKIIHSSAQAPTPPSSLTRHLPLSGEEAPQASSGSLRSSPPAKGEYPVRLGEGVGVPNMGTFHSICAKILRQEISRLGYSRGFTIYDADDQQKVVKEIIQDLGVDKRFNPSLFRAYISSAKNVLQLPSEFSIGLEADMHNLVASVYVRYQDYLYRQNAVDFDDLLMLTVKIFQNFPDVLGKYRDLFKYILVDEYQDTNHAQYVMLYLLAENHHNLFVVGDDAQSIYGFRGSNIRNILNFEQGFPEAKVIKLEQNYRSTKNILAVAQKVIELNPEQKPKVLWTENDDGRAIEVHELEDEVDEAEFVCRTIITLSTRKSTNTETNENEAGELEYVSEEEEKPVFSILDHFLKKHSRSSGQAKGLHYNLGRRQLPKDHTSLNQFAVLFRTHAQTRALEEVFIESGIPYRIVGGLRFYERKEIKDVIAYIRLALNYRDLLSLKRVINEPARGVGEKSYMILRDLILKESVGAALARPQSDDGRPNVGAAMGRHDDRIITPSTLEMFRSRLKDIKFGPKIAAAVDNFFELVDRLSSLNPEEDLAALMRLIVKRTGYEEWVRDGTDTGEARWENIQELFNVAEKFRGLPWREGAEGFLEEVALITEVDEAAEKGEQKDAVTMMTLHSAKGLEFDTVFLVGLEEGILPHSRSLLNPSEISEEIRLAYVGLTRARHRLFLAFARRRRSFGSLNYNQPSRILRALPKDKVIYRGSSFGGFLEEGEAEGN